MRSTICSFAQEKLQNGVSLLRWILLPEEATLLFLQKLLEEIERSSRMVNEWGILSFYLASARRILELLLSTKAKSPPISNNSFVSKN